MCNTMIGRVIHMLNKLTGHIEYKLIRLQNKHICGWPNRLPYLHVTIKVVRLHRKLEIIHEIKT